MIMKTESVKNTGTNGQEGAKKKIARGAGKKEQITRGWGTRGQKNA